MKKLDIDQKVALLANIGVILSLVFVGVRIHQSAQATRSATTLQLKSNWVQLNLAEATSPDLARAFDDASTNGWDKASSASRSMVGGFLRTLFPQLVGRLLPVPDGDAGPGAVAAIRAGDEDRRTQSADTKSMVGLERRLRRLLPRAHGWIHARFQRFKVPGCQVRRESGQGAFGASKTL